MSARSPQLRAAEPAEAATITQLALRSKRRWGYDEAFMAAITPVMTLTPDDLATARVEVLESGDRLLGFLRLVREAEHAWLEDLFVEPQAVGQGYGRLLFERAVELARADGYRSLRFESDPHAEPFYLQMGAQRIGMSRVASVPGRSVPLMEYRLRQGEAPG
jgi:GNAT superfamily N-acetyltransferase